MSYKLFRRRVAQWILTTMFLVLAFRGFAQYTNGIYAEFNTSMGSYTCVLNSAESPKAVANFIGLATGQKAWLDLPSGVIKTNPFYNGIIFHRVVTNFVIQAGSPNGVGTDGPGYAFVDEITNTLQFNKFGVLAMANSGPDSNGSQFFVLATNSYPSLNNGYTIFGSLYGGSNVIYAINHVATDASNKPLVNVYINSVNIQRIGAAAINFDITAQGLPVVTNLNLAIAQAGTNVSLTFSNRLYADNRLYGSTNLLNWTANQLGIETAMPIGNVLTQSMTAPAKFFRAVQIQYASNTFTPKSWSGKTLALFYSSGFIGTNLINFDVSGGGTYVFTGSSAYSGTLVGYNWSQRPFNGSIAPISFNGGLADEAMQLHFTKATGGTFSGGAYPLGYPITLFAYGIAGTFTNSP